MSGKIRTIVAVLALAMMADVTFPSAQTIITATESDPVSAVIEDKQQDLTETVSNETSDGDYLRGDVDLDGKVTQVDATIILRESLLEPTGSNSILEELITEEGKKKFPDTYIEMSHRNGDVDQSDGGSKFVQTDATFILRALLESNISGESFISDSTWNRNIENIKEENDMASMNALVHIKDDNGNVNDIYPATKIENVEGLQTALNSKANTSDVTSGLAGKVDKETGKGLSTNDYTTTEKNKLAGIEAQANKTVVDSALSTTSTNPVQNKVINTALGTKANSSDVTTALASKADTSAVTALSTQVSANTADIATQTSRIDNIVALPEGSTTGDAELIDGRVGADGKTYTNIGDAIRGQISEVNKEIDSVDNTIGRVEVASVEFSVNGYISKSTGNLNASNDYRCTPYIYIKDLEFDIDAVPYQDAGMAFYDSSKTFIAGSGVNNYDVFTIPSNAEYIRVSTQGSTPTGIVRVFKQARDTITHNYQTRNQGKWANINDGIVRNENGYYTTPMFLLEDDMVINCTPNLLAGMCFYDSSKTFISGTSNYTNPVIPENAKYAIVSHYGSSQGSVTTSTKTLDKKIKDIDEKVTDISTIDIESTVRMSGFGYISTPTSENNDLNTLAPNKVYVYNSPSGVSHVPFTTNSPFSVLTHNSYSKTEVNGSTQIVIRKTDGQMFTRVCTLDVWGAWTTDVASMPLRTILNDSLNITPNKRYAFFGDSITYGVLGYREIEEWTTENFVKLFMQKVGASSYSNRSVAGATLSRKLTNNIMSQLSGATLSDYDIIVIAAGTNDYGQNTEASTFISGLEEIMNYLESNFDGEVIFITPIRRIVDIGDDIHERVLPLEWYAEQIYEYAAMNEYNVVNGFDLGFTRNPGTFMAQTMSDGLHPTYLGYRMYAKGLYRILNDNISN